LDIYIYKSKLKITNIVYNNNYVNMTLSTCCYMYLTNNSKGYIIYKFYQRIIYNKGKRVDTSIYFSEFICLKFKHVFGYNNIDAVNI